MKFNYSLSPKRSSYENFEKEMFDEFALMIASFLAVGLIAFVIIITDEDVIKRNKETKTYLDTVMAHALEKIRKNDSSFLKEEFSDSFDNKIEISLKKKNGFHFISVSSNGLDGKSGTKDDIVKISEPFILEVNNE